jgi:alkanesulfonate monooxygenase SsuD/methylene tetrahydromethanopterin reductase-like flavin-dependent oxidoreductase (luciferase family)
MLVLSFVDKGKKRYAKDALEICKKGIPNDNISGRYRFLSSACAEGASDHQACRTNRYPYGLANRPRPPLIVSAPIVLGRDFAAVQKLAHAAWDNYSSYPTYAKMFKEGGYPLTPDGKLTDELIHELFLYGDEDTIRKRLYALHDAGVDEIVTGIYPLRDAEHEQRMVMEILASI